MAEANIAAVAGGVAGFLASIFGTVLSRSLIDSRKERLSDYNAVVDRLVENLDSLGQSAQTYWLSAEYLEDQKLNILRLTSLINSDIYTAFSLQRSIFKETDAIAAFRQYWSVITGAGWAASLNHSADPKRIETAMRYFIECRRIFQSYRYRWGIYMYWPGGAVR